MRFAIAVVLAASSVAVAQTAAAAAPTGGICAQDIVDACVDHYDPLLEKCEGNDYICLCDNYTNKLTCYNNCMGSVDRAPVQNQVTQFCLAAAPLSSASIASVKSAMKSASAAAATASATASTSTEATATDATASATVASASGFNSEKTGAAVAMQVPMGGAVAVMLGLAGLL